MYLGTCRIAAPWRRFSRNFAPKPLSPRGPGCSKLPVVPSSTTKRIVAQVLTHLRKKSFSIWRHVTSRPPRSGNNPNLLIYSTFGSTSFAAPAVHFREDSRALSVLSQLHRETSPLPPFSFHDDRYSGCFVSVSAVVTNVRRTLENFIREFFNVLQPFAL